MDKISGWIFACVTAALLLYACNQYLTVQQNLHEAQTCLAELNHTAERLSEENEMLSRDIDSWKDRMPEQPGKHVSGEKREASDSE